MNFILSISVGVVKLTGPAGTGKTRLLQQLQTELQAEKQETLLFTNPPASIKELHDAISRQLCLDNEFGFNKALIHHIIAKPYDQQRLVVMFDDAEKIDMDVLLAVALFRNIMHNNQPIISIVLCGSEALNRKLEDPSYRPLVQDMLLSYELNPLTREQLQAYGNAAADIHRLGKLPLRNGVLTELLKESQGLPGAVPALLKKLRDKPAPVPVEVPVATVKQEAPAPAKSAPAAAKPAVAAAVAKPLVAEAAKPVIAQATKPVVAEVAKPVVAEVAKPVVAEVAKPVVAEVAKPVVAEVAKPVVADVAKPVVAEVTKPVVADVAKPVVAEVMKPVVADIAKPVVAELAKPVVVEAVRPAATAGPTPVVTTVALSPDEQLILASRAEKAAGSGKFAFTVDWQRWKPAIQRSALVAGLLVVIVVGWPRVAPTIGNLYTSLTGGASKPPAQVAATEPAAESDVTEATPEPTPPAAEPAPAVPAPQPEPEPVQVATATPAPAPAPTATTPAPAQQTSIPGPTVTNANADQLEMVIRDWLMAWEQQDVDNFFSYYHTDFAPLYQNTLAAWRNDRQSKISRPTSIMIELEDFMIGPSSRLGTRVSFWMNYETPNYADRTLKEVLIGPDLDGRLRILQEYNQQVAQVDPATFRAGMTVAASSQAPATPQGRQRTRIATGTLPFSAFPGAAVQPPVVSNRASLSQDQIDEIARFLAAWLTAWQDQDTNEYFRHYAPEYKPAFMASVEQWRNDRVEKIKRPTRIVLRMDELQILGGDEASVRVQLVLEYHSTHYADRTVKEIELQKAASGDWLITLEKNKEVEALPLMRLLPMDSLTLLF